NLPAAVGESAADRRRLWSYRERHPEAAGFLGVPLKLDVSVPAAHWVQLASSVASVVAGTDPGARMITFGHVADGNVHVNIVPAAPADGRHEDAVFSFVAALGGSISAEHGIGALKAPWLHLARGEAERGLFTRIRRALDPTGTLNPHVLPRLSCQLKRGGRRGQGGGQSISAVQDGACGKAGAWLRAFRFPLRGPGEWRHWHPKPGPRPGLATSPPSVTSPPGSSAKPAATTSPPPSATPNTTTTCPQP
ncbi:MAG TPA: FAD-linked oxidase C-terminal domain-containing protein, partial [Actinocrinis sp.]|nr:FAD-linked oxidase C-terminal domain-containing protein [Actinocrinis sp.]